MKLFLLITLIITLVVIYIKENGDGKVSNIDTLNLD